MHWLKTFAFFWTLAEYNNIKYDSFLCVKQQPTQKGFVLGS